jgi:hypothetical protein
VRSRGVGGRQTPRSFDDHALGGRRPKKAEAEAQSKALQGQGIANQRKAIIEGLQGSIEQFQKSVAGASTSEVMRLVLVTQWHHAGVSYLRS